MNKKKIDEKGMKKLEEEKRKRTDNGVVHCFVSKRSSKKLQTKQREGKQNCESESYIYYSNVTIKQLLKQTHVFLLEVLG